jgi:hypothetical protein
MACRTLELTLVSARDLRAVNLVSKMEVYAVAYEASDPCSRQRVPADRADGRNPTWNVTVLLTVPASAGIRWQNNDTQCGYLHTVLIDWR